MIVISDIHGCYRTFMELLKQLPHNDICILGDMIDRGNDSYKVVDYIKSNNIKCILGNHEDMAIQVSNSSPFDEFNLMAWWYNNGGNTTRKSYKEHNMDINIHINWFKTLPLYLEYTNKDSQHYILSHSNINMVWDKRGIEPEIFKEWCLWSRYFDKSMYGDSKINKSINIIGHTPKQYVVEDEDLIFIDTGCVYSKYGYLSAYDLETKEVYRQKFID